MDEVESHEMDVREFVSRPPFEKRDLSSQELALFCAALTHDSYTNEMLNLPAPRNVPSYERLEFLGDAVLEMVACERIYKDTDLAEGGMTDMKQDIVANHRLSERILACGIDIDVVLLVGHGHRDPRTKANIVEENMRADAFEAMIGAFYILYGLDEARRVIDEVLSAGRVRA